MRYCCSFCLIQYNFHNPTAITPMPAARKNPPKKEPASNDCRGGPDVAAVVTVVADDGVAVVTFPSAGRQHKTDKPSASRH